MAILIRRNEEFTDVLKNNLMSKHEERRRLDNTVHVSDILPTACIRRQYYSRKFPESLSNESVHHFVRGESSEFVITQLADIGVSQAEIEMDGIVGHIDIMNDKIIVELKDTVSGTRLDFYNDSFSTFRSYVRQLLYYMIMTGIEKGILSIRYNIKELRWVKRDDEGDYFFRPFDAKDVGIESFEVRLPSDDVIREILKNEMVRRKNLFLKALEESDVSILPRLIDDAKRIKCPYCPYYEKCGQDSESQEAQQMSKEIDLLDIGGVVDIDVKPS
jgi:hypothetical protein